MQVSRNQLLFFAVFLILVGAQLRAVAAYVLTADVSRYLAERALAADPATAGVAKSLPANLPPVTIRPPQWVGSLLVAVGVVLFFQALAMKPNG